MTATTITLLAGVLSFGGADSSEAQAHVADTLRISAVEVPFVAQGPLLCGGAAAAMVERFWGARGVYGEDFQHLVRPEEGGIRAADLSAAMQERRYSATPATHEPDLAFAALESGIPPILLLESGATRLHYVVLVGMEGENVWIHDPNFGPDRRVAREELIDRWAASGYWTLLVTPSATEKATRSGETEPSISADTRVASADPVLVEAMDLLRRDDPAGAREAVRPLLTRGGAAAVLGRRIMATGWFMDGEAERALVEWNALGEPTIDLVRIEGARATRHHVVADRMSLQHGELLTPTALALSRRRLAQLPAVQLSRVAYQPLPDGTVEVVASVLERGRLPGPRAFVVEGARGLVNRRASLEAGPLMASGDRWRVAGSWEQAQRYVGGAVSTPAPPLPGIVTVGVEWRRERFGTAEGGEEPVVAILTEKRRRAWLGLEEWIHPRVRVGASMSLESWNVPEWADAADPDAVTRLVGGGLTVHGTTEHHRSWFTVRSDFWAGDARSFGKTSLEAGTTVPRGERREWRLRAGGIAASSGAPRMTWPGAGTGRIREPLLRAHDLDEDGAIRGPAFGRELVHGTIEHRFFRSAGPLRAGVALFADAAHVWSRPGPAEDRGFIAVGAGLFLDLGSRGGAVSLARGSDGWKLSAQVGGRP